MKPGNAVTVRGVHYSSFYAAEQAHGIKRGKALARTQAGWTVEQAFDLAPPPPSTRGQPQPQAVEVRGVRFDTLRAAALAYGVQAPTFAARLRRGLTPEAALGLDGSGFESATKPLAVGGSQYASTAAACRSLGVDVAVFHARRRIGWSVDQALGAVASPHAGLRCFGRVYLVTHGASGKSYVGLTKTSIERRWAGHIASALSERRPVQPGSLQAAIRDYGASAFEVRELATAQNEGELAELERRYIQQLGTRGPGGYNMRSGGAGIHHAGRSVVVAGRRFSSLSATCAELGVTIGAVKFRRKAGDTLDEAFSRPTTPTSQAMTFGGVTYASASKLAQAFGVHSATFRKRIADGWPLEQALGIASR